MSPVTVPTIPESVVKAKDAIREALKHRWPMKLSEIQQVAALQFKKYIEDADGDYALAELTCEKEVVWTDGGGWKLAG